MKKRAIITKLLSFATAFTVAATTILANGATAVAADGDRFAQELIPDGYAPISEVFTPSEFGYGNANVLGVPGYFHIFASGVYTQSGHVHGNFAAGNIYTGRFKQATLTPVGAKLDWGIPFDSRPLALRGWYRYEPQNINQGSYVAQGQPDYCQIQIFLTNWSGPFEISTGDKRFVVTSESNKSIIAHGEIISQDNTTDNEGNRNGYIQFTIPLRYRSLENPSYIVVAGAASRYGDYFTGGLGSTLYLDELELVYDPDELTPEQYEIVMGGIR